MAENKDSGSELTTELENMGDLDMELGLDNDNSADMVELKNRMDKTDQEMRAMTEAMKSTLLDVRSLMQDMDNPFNMLRDMGVDKLVNVAVETVEGEVNKQKREEAKKRMADGEEDDNNQSLVKVEGAAAAQPMPGYNAPVRVAEPSESPVVQSITPSVQEPAMPSSVSQPSSGGQKMVVGESMSPVVAGQAPSPHVMPSNNLYLEERIAQTENSVNQLVGTVNDLVKVIKLQSKPSSKPQIQGLTGTFEESGDYYQAYVSLIADYLLIRLGEKGSEEVLLEGMYKEWASPQVVRDIMDKLSSNKKQSKKNQAVLGGDVEDKLLITSLLRNLDKPVSEWGESTHLFLLLALVSRARENQGNRS
ncbi:MAG: hypothetical protein NWF07_10800 [Candidatus Bathyarchaeota archaeon]|nr:hypothetical protein [Candidatus Bathyarchaeota archaeon]